MEDKTNLSEPVERECLDCAALQGDLCSVHVHEDRDRLRRRKTLVSHLVAAFLLADDGSIEESLIAEAHNRACHAIGIVPQENIAQAIHDQDQAKDPIWIDRLSALVASVKAAKIEASSLAAPVVLESVETRETFDHLMQAHFRLTEADAHLKVVRDLNR